MTLKLIKLIDLVGDSIIYLSWFQSPDLLFEFFLVFRFFFLPADVGGSDEHAVEEMR
jgi:hypothetical protein